jgi:hypothetical protein
MGLQHQSIVSWRLRLASPPVQVCELLADEAGRPRFRSELEIEPGMDLAAILSRGAVWEDADVDREPPYRFTVRYATGGVTTCDVADDGAGGSEVVVTDVGTVGEDRTDVLAAWVAALSAIKATVDFTLDLHTRDQLRTWFPDYAEH